MHFFRHFILLFCILTLTGCAGTADLFAYTRGAAQFDLLFPSVSGDTDAIVCACSRDGTGNFTLTVTEPARLSGFTAELRDGRALCRAVCRLDGTEIPLSDDAAAGLIRLFTILTEEGSHPERSASAGGNRNQRQKNRRGMERSLPVTCICRPKFPKIRNDRYET